MDPDDNISLIQALQEKQLQTEAQVVDIQSKLDQILSALSGNTAAPVVAPIPTVPATPSRSNRLKPATPSEFDGDRLRGRAFLNSCETYYRLCPDQFIDEQALIIWAMSYMKSGRAARWADRVFRYEHSNPGVFRFLDWEDFQGEFKKEFTPANSEASAVNKLEEIGYFQKTRSVDDYLDEFRDLIWDSGYKDPKTIVVKFRRGLSASIQNAIATMVTGRPSDTDPEGWYSAALLLDQSRAANEAFQASRRPPTTTSRPPTTSVFRMPPSLTPSPSPLRNAHLVPTPGNPIPMDIDAAKGKAPLPLTCYRCGQPGHKKPDCPQRFDIRMMSTEEQEELLQKLLFEKDIPPKDQPEDDPEDFVSRSE
jgi:hypothetical protein